MVKAPSSSSIHQKKFKPWRRGKSNKGKNSGKSNSSSLKGQLRGLLRLRDKNASSLKEETQARIESLQAQIKAREITERERTNATKSHKTRFLERQHTMRRYKKLLKETPPNEKELYKLALDQIYIAHYPLADTSYLSLYGNKDSDKTQRRHVMNARLLFKMAMQRKTALKKSRLETRVPWVPEDQYERVKHVDSWDTELERTTFGIQNASKELKTTTKHIADDRFQVSKQQTELLAEAEDIAKQIDDESNETANNRKQEEDESPQDDVSSNDSSSSDADDDDSSSSDDSNSNDLAGNDVRTTASLVADGFLTADTTSTNVFDTAKRQEPTNKKADKSLGWATQRQFPGEFRKRRRR